MRDIAQKLGVTHSTVSLALRGDPRISAERREAVKATAEAMGYRPDPVMTAFTRYRGGKRPARIRDVLIWLNLWDSKTGLQGFREFAAYWRGARAAAERHGYHLEDMHWDGSASTGRLDTILRTRNVGGILLPPVHHQPDLARLSWGEFSFVRFGYSIKGLPGHIVTSDQLGDALMAFEKIRATGYERIGFVAHSHAFTRFAAGVAIGQLALRDSLRVPGIVLPEKDAEKALRSWVARHRPDAILSDIPGIKALLGRAGLHVPRDMGLAVTSVLDCDADAGINQNSEEIGRVAVETLVSLIYNHERGFPRHIREVLVAGDWVDGSSLPPRTVGGRPQAALPKF